MLEELSLRVGLGVLFLDELKLKLEESKIKKYKGDMRSGVNLIKFFFNLE